MTLSSDIGRIGLLRARKRGDHERLPARSRQARHRRLPGRPRRLRRQGALLPDAERRDVDGRGDGREAAGADVCQRSDQLDAGRGISVRKNGGDRARHRRYDDRRRPAAQGLSAAGDHDRGHRWCAHQFPHAGRVQHRARRRLDRGGRRASAPYRPAQRRLSIDAAGQGVRRRCADGNRHRRRRRPCEHRRCEPCPGYRRCFHPPLPDK